MKKVWFITGSSRGLGRKITEVALPVSLSIDHDDTIDKESTSG